MPNHGYSSEVIHSVDAGFYSLDFNWRFVEIDRHAAKRFDRQPGELIGKVIWDEFPHLNGTSLEAAFRDAMHLRQAHRAEIQVKQSGRWFNVAIHPSPDGISVSWQDITDQKQVEDALNESEGRYKIFVDSIAQAAWETDAVGMVVTDSPSWRAYTGQTVDEFLGEGWLNAVHPEDREPTIIQWRKDAAAGQNFSIEYRLKGPDGLWRWSNVLASPIRDRNGLITKWIGMNTDISRRKKAEEALLTSEKQMRLAMEAAKLTSWVINVETGELTFSDNFDEVTEFPRSLIPVDFLSAIDNYFPTEEAARWRLELEKTIRGEGDFHLEFYALHPRTGSVIWMEAFATLIASTNDAPARITGIVRDVTERKLAEVKLRESEERALTMVEKLRLADENKNIFLSLLSHELRNPLASILMGASLLNKIQMDGEQAEKISYYIELIARQTTQLTQLVDDLLDMTRITRHRISLKKERIELNNLVRQAVTDHQGQFDVKGVGLTSEYVPEPLYLEADPVRMTQVIGNLLHNAVKFSDKGDETRISVSKAEDTKEAIITVRDQGIGIESDFLAYIFEPFMQADQSLDRSGGGLGLGLVIAKGIIDLHGGKIEVSSEGPGHGSQFTIHLPMTNVQDEPLINGYGLRVIGQNSRPLLIQMIDDNLDLIEIMGEMLEIMGHESLAAVNGLEGIKLAKARKPDVIICDIGLPDMSGYEVAKVIRHIPELKDVILIAFSGYAQPEDIERSRAAGFQRHLAKPIHAETLKKILAEIH